MAKSFALIFLVLFGLTKSLGEGTDTNKSPTSTHPPSSIPVNTTVPTGTDTNKSHASTHPPSSTPVNTTVPTGSSSKCEYSVVLVKENNQSDVYEVHIEVKNRNHSQNYSVILKDSYNETIEEGDFHSNTYQFLRKSLKPCNSYAVSFGPNCALNGSNTLHTRDWGIADVKLEMLKWTNQTKQCFDTKWNMTTCFEKINPCRYNFTATSCLQYRDVNFPLLETPDFSFNKHPISFKWTNRPTECNGTVTFTCTDNNLSSDIVEGNVSLKPYRNYSCTGKYNNFSEDWIKPFLVKWTFPVNFTCDLQISEPMLSADTTCINASWNLSSSNCEERKLNFEVNCDPSHEHARFKHHCKGERKNLNESSKCEVKMLFPDTNYTCIFTAKYNKATIVTHPKNITTLSGIPTIEKIFIVIIHNKANVKYEVNWNGTQGQCNLELRIGEKLAHNLMENPTGQRGNECVFNVTDLYYLTEYTFKPYAINHKGNKSEMLKEYVKIYSTQYNYKALLGFLVFLIVVTSLALLFIMYKIFALQRKQSREVCEMDHLLPSEHLLHVEPISSDALVETYRRKIADEGRLFMDEFQSIPRIFSNYTVKEAKKSENQSKNRYVDILPYDYNRVCLSSGGSHDYINASFIEGYKEPNKYIAAQGPKEETVGDFWRMVWEQKSSIIVMVARCEEGNKNKCAQYWPSVERETEIFDNFVVKIKHEAKCPDYIIRQLSLMNQKEKTAERDVTHIQFMSWPDHGIPGEPGLLLKLRRRVNSFKNIFSGPIVVHCSAGVGRTGTYIGIDAMIESLEAEGRVDIYGYVVKLRRQRCLMVQVEAQYVLIHTALIEYNQFGESEISLADFHSTVNTLKQKEGNDPSLLELEYQKLPKFKNWRASNMAFTEENKKKNRSSVVPYDFNRVLVKLEEETSHNGDADEEEDYSSDEDDDAATKYINASYMDGYWCPKSLITTQGPLANTVEDFLQMLYQKQVQVVVMLSDCMENDEEFCIQYWAEEKREFGEMEVEVKETEPTPTYIRRRLQIQSTKGKGSLMTEQYHFLKWAGHELPANPLDLIDMMKSIRQKVGPCNSTDNQNTPIAVHCNDGSSRSGIFCALWKLLDSAETEKLVDVFQVAKAQRKERLGMFTTLEQYQFLYEALQAAFPVQNGELKKAFSPDTLQVINEESGTTSADQEEAVKSQATENPVVASPENPIVAPPENQAVEKPDTAIATPSPEEGSSESSSVPSSEKKSSESATNGPAVTVEV